MSSTATLISETTKNTRAQSPPTITALETSALAIFPAGAQIDIAVSAKMRILPFITLEITKNTGDQSIE